MEVITGVVKSDKVVSDDLKKDLQSAVSPLENVPDREKDWHPGSEEQVLDLVHPSLYPLVHGQTRILADGTVGLDDCTKRCGNGEVLSRPLASEWERRRGCSLKQDNNAWSHKFQWLPSEFDLPAGSDDVM